MAAAIFSTAPMPCGNGRERPDNPTLKRCVQGPPESRDLPGGLRRDRGTPGALLSPNVSSVIRLEEPPFESD
ncbi:hypothetical protein NDU88_003642 [Pleurodeles waltl]|uniref:Uncharacterized protein n=1 Tax=Pleurodeles waltl TaxID=8319 RepID=A0AAV7VGM5_PLEWA|nr:hypothetical protein NDU88_003642 [Pleurodeles waltl]